MRVHPDLEAELDAWIAAQPEPKPSKPEAIRQFLKKGLERVRPSADQLS